MLIDSRRVPNGYTVSVDVCIVGAGAAGIAVALELADKSFRVGLMESGGFEFDGPTQSLYAGEIAGLPYTPLEAARVRQFGGTTNHWAGWCRPLEELDFEYRDWVPYSGWPLTRAILLPYYRRAEALCELGPWGYTTQSLSLAEQRRTLKFLGRRIITETFQFSPPTRFGRRYRDTLLRARNIDVYLFANASRIETTPNAATVDRLRIATLAKNTFDVRARYYVIAAGGIENARLLLVSDQIESAGVGNENGLVGRFFMDHVELKSGVVMHRGGRAQREFYTREAAPAVSLQEKLDGTMGQYLPDDEKRRILRWVRNGAPEPEYRAVVAPVLRQRCAPCHSPGGIAFFRPLTTYDAARSAALGGRTRQSTNGPGVRGMLTLSPAATRHERLPGACVVLEPLRVRDLVGTETAWESGVAAVGALEGAIQDVLQGRPAAPLDSLLRVVTLLEPRPDPESRVTLTTDRDELGLNRVRVNWRVGQENKRTLTRLHEILATALGRAGLGRMMVSYADEGPTWPEWMQHGWHHMGTTRMADSPKAGVVDRDCRVHGKENLFIAGSSVFPTYGFAPPTLTIVALAVRLAEHLTHLFSASHS